MPFPRPLPRPYRGARRLAHLAVVVVTEPPFVPRPLRPRTIAEAVLERAPVAIDSLLDRFDLTQLVIDHVSVPRIVAALDMDEVLSKLDLSGIAAKVVDDIDLPDLIRDSTTSVASESVVGV